MVCIHKYVASNLYDEIIADDLNFHMNNSLILKFAGYTIYWIHMDWLSKSVAQLTKDARNYIWEYPGAVGVATVCSHKDTSLDDRITI